MKKIVYISFLILFVITESIGQLGGKTAFDFLRLADNARIAAVGGEAVALSHRDPNMFMYNPATLSSATANQFSINYLPFYANVKKSTLTYTLPSQKTGNWGFGLTYINYGDMQETDINGMELGTFSNNEYAFVVSKAHEVENFAVGVNMKLVGSQIYSYNAFGAMADIGGLFTHPERDFKVGLVFKNVGYVFKNYRPEVQSNTPFEVQFGASYKLDHMPLRLIMTTHNLHIYDAYYFDPTRNLTFDDDGNQVPEQKKNSEKIARHFIIGGEFVFSDNFNLRFGYNHLRRKEMRIEERGGLAGFSFGAMLRTKIINIEFTKAYFHLAGGATMLSLTMDTARIFGGSVTRNPANFNKQTLEL